MATYKIKGFRADEQSLIRLKAISSQIGGASTSATIRWCIDQVFMQIQKKQLKVVVIGFLLAVSLFTVHQSVDDMPTVEGVSNPANAEFMATFLCVEECSEGTGI